MNFSCFFSLRIKANDGTDNPARLDRDPSKESRILLLPIPIEVGDTCHVLVLE